MPTPPSPRPWPSSSGSGAAEPGFHPRREFLRIAGEVKPLGAGGLAGNQHHLRLPELETLGDEGGEGRVGGAFDRRRRHPQAENRAPVRIDADTVEAGAARPRRQPHGEGEAVRIQCEGKLRHTEALIGFRFPSTAIGFGGAGGEGRFPASRANLRRPTAAAIDSYCPDGFFSPHANNFIAPRPRSDKQVVFAVEIAT